MKRLLTSEKHYNLLSSRHQQLLSCLKTQYLNIERCIEQNYKIIQCIISNSNNMFETKDSAPINVRNHEHMCIL